MSSSLACVAWFSWWEVAWFTSRVSIFAVMLSISPFMLLKHFHLTKQKPSQSTSVHQIFQQICQWFLSIDCPIPLITREWLCWWCVGVWHDSLPDVSDDLVHLLTVVQIILLLFLFNSLLSSNLISNLATLRIVLNCPENVAWSRDLEDRVNKWESL